MNEGLYKIESLDYNAYEYAEITDSNLNDAFFIGELYKHIDNIVQDIKYRLQIDISSFIKDGYDIPVELWGFLEPSIDDNVKNLKRSIAYLSHISDMSTKVGIFQAKTFYEQLNKQINNELYSIYWDINKRLKNI